MIKRFKEDKGASVTLFGLAILVLILLLATFIVDFSKTMYIKNLYSMYAQKSTQTAIKQQDSIGGLLPSSAEVVVSEYMALRNGRSDDNIYNTQEARNVVRNGNSCTLKGNYPHFTIKYDTLRDVGASSASYSSQGGTVPFISDAPAFYQKQYKAVEVQITDVTDNYFGGIFGRKCQELHITVSAITSGHYDEEDLGR